MCKLGDLAWRSFKEKTLQILWWYVIRLVNGWFLSHSWSRFGFAGPNIQPVAWSPTTFCPRSLRDGARGRISLPRRCALCWCCPCHPPACLHQAHTAARLYAGVTIRAASWPHETGLLASNCLCTQQGTGAHAKCTWCHISGHVPVKWQAESGMLTARCMCSSPLRITPQLILTLHLLFTCIRHYTCPPSSSWPKIQWMMEALAALPGGLSDKEHLLRYMTMTELSALPAFVKAEQGKKTFFFFFFKFLLPVLDRDFFLFSLFKETHSPSFFFFIKTENLELGFVRLLDQDFYCFLVYLPDITLEAAKWHCNSGDLFSRYFQGKFCV